MRVCAVGVVANARLLSGPVHQGSPQGVCDYAASLPRPAPGQACLGTRSQGADLRRERRRFIHHHHGHDGSSRGRLDEAMEEGGERRRPQQ
ncbi:hypothetical protein LX36DRAFT_661641, partial [Colletotrichum falcatum]